MCESYVAGEKTNSTILRALLRANPTKMLYQLIVNKEKLRYSKLNTPNIGNIKGCALRN